MGMAVLGGVLLGVKQEVSKVATDRQGLHFLGKNEVAMVPGMRITAKTSAGTISITALNALTRAYTWEGATRSLVMDPRGQRWDGSLGLYYPGPGDHWPEHHGITRAVVEEGQQHLKSVRELPHFFKERGSLQYVYRNDGLAVGWGKVLERRQLNVEVWQIVVEGHKPKSLPGANDGAISVSAIPLKTRPLLKAVQNGNLEAVKRLLQKGANPNEADEGGQRALEMAIQQDNRPMVEALLQAKADPNARTAEGGSMLFGAEDPKIVSLLLEHGANPDATLSAGMLSGLTPLHNAVEQNNVQVVRLLLDHGANPNAGGADGVTPLVIVCLADGKNHLEIAQLLLDHRADPKQQDWAGVTPLMMAARWSPNLVKLLIDRGAEVNARTDIVRSFFRSAQLGGLPEEVIEALKTLAKNGELDKLKADGYSALDEAKSEEARKILIANGALRYSKQAEPAEQAFFDRLKKMADQIKRSKQNNR